MKRSILTVLVVAIVGALALPAGSVPERRKPAPTTTTTTWPPLPAFDTAVAWSDCGDGFECGTLTVPVDWKVPTGEQVGIALIRHPAESSDRIGALVVNYGGPGESGVSYLRNTWSRLPETARARFDIVSFDPRGTGASRPIDCVDDAFLDLSAGLPTVPSTAAQLDAVHRYNEQFAAGCVQRMGAYAGQVGTRNVARDVEAIRIALGQAKLDYLGYSYGTVVGSTYAQMFPTAIGHMVLDGPPDYSLAPRDYAYQQAQGFMNALQRVPRLVPADRLLPRVRRRAPRRAPTAHRPGRPAAAPRVVPAQRRDARRRADPRPARERGDRHALRRIPGLARPRRRAARGGPRGSGRVAALAG